jgi:hypothetical protein
VLTLQVLVEILIFEIVQIETGYPGFNGGGFDRIFEI